MNGSDFFRKLGILSHTGSFLRAFANSVVANKVFLADPQWFGLALKTILGLAGIKSTYQNLDGPESGPIHKTEL